MNTVLPVSRTNLLWVYLLPAVALFGLTSFFSFSTDMLGILAFFPKVRVALFISLLSVALLTNSKSLLSMKKNKSVEKIIDIVLTIPAWTAFVILAILSLTTIPVVALFYGLEKLFSNRRLALRMRFVADSIVCLLAIISLFIFGVRTKVYGTLPKDTRVIVANHEGSMDYFLIALAIGFKPSAVVAGTNLLKFPIFGWFLKLKCVMLERDKKKIRQRYKSQNTAKEFIERKIDVAYFSNGRLRKGEGLIMREFDDGAFKLACETNTPVTPIVFIGSGKIKPPMKNDKTVDQWWLHPDCVEIHILSDFDIEAAVEAFKIDTNL